MKNITKLILVFVFSVIAMSQETQRSGFGIFVDNTGSLRPQIDMEIEAANEVLKQVKPGSYVYLFGFATDPTSNSRMARFAVGAQCSTDRDLVKKQIDGLFTVPGQTTLFDAIKTSAEYLDTKRPDKCDAFAEKSLVVITDGEDRASVTREKDLIKSLKAQGIKVYVIGLIEDLSKEGGFVGKSPYEKARGFLEKLTNETGGNVVFPKKKQSITDVIKKLFESNTNK